MRPHERLVSDQTDSPDFGSTIQYSVRVREPCRAGRIATYVAHIRDRIEKTGGTSAPAPPPHRLHLHFKYDFSPGSAKRKIDRSSSFRPLRTIAIAASSAPRLNAPPIPAQRSTVFGVTVGRPCLFMQGAQDARGDSLNTTLAARRDERDIKIEEGANATSAACLSLGACTREGRLAERASIERIRAVSLYCNFIATDPGVFYRRASLIPHRDRRRD